MSEPIEWPEEPPTEPPLETRAESTDERPPPPPEERRRPVASPWTRALEVGVELVLMVCTFGFGWVGWWIIAWADGQSPAKVVLHLHVVRADDGTPASFGRMAVREALGKAVAGLLIGVGLYLRLWWLLAIGAAFVAASIVLALTDNRRRTVWDRLAKTAVLEGDPPPPVVEPAPIAPVEVDIALW